MTPHVITARNVNHALTSGVMWLNVAGVKEDSRNGPVLVAPGPVLTVYQQPCERVLFNPVRDANGVFHLMEALWMLAGQNKVDWLLQFNSKFEQYAEDDGKQWGAYGYRWRRQFGMDQLFVLRNELRNPQTRQAVLAMWDCNLDLGSKVRDKPCNTHIYFDRRGGKLNMTVCCRSNDMVYGAYGANAVHMSILQELLALELDVPVGTYMQFSNNFHAYTEVPVARALLDSPPLNEYDFYQSGLCQHTPLLDVDAGETMDDFLDDCELLVGSSDNDRNYATKFFKTVAVPLCDSYMLRKQRMAFDYRLKNVPKNNDWGMAFQQWVDRRAA